MNRWLALVAGLAFVVAAGSFACIASNPTYPVVAPATPVVTMPLYGAGLVQPQGQSAPTTNNDERLARLEQKLDRVLAILEAAAAEPKAGAAPTVTSRDALASAAQKCATCHHADVADAKGGGFRMFTPAGAFAPLAPRIKQQAVKRLTTTDPSFQMPPPPSGITIAENERAALAAEFGKPP